MGASHSTPPPCVDVPTIYAPYGRIQVPAGSPFAVYPPASRRRPRRVRIEYGEEDGCESESESELEMEMPMRGMSGGVGMRGRRFGMRGGLGGRGMAMGRGMEFYEGNRPRSAPTGMGYPAMGMGMGSPRMGGPPMGMGDGMGPPGMGGPMGMGGPRGGMDGSMGGMGGGPLGMGGSGGMGSGPMSARGPGGMRGRPGGMPPPDMGDMQRPGGMMGGPPQGMNGMSDLPPRYSAPPPGQNPYAFGPPSVSSRSSATARPPRRPPGAHKHIPMGAYAAQSPRISRSHTSPTTAERIHRKTTGDSGKEWIKGDDFLDACICTTGCTCREGHRVLYRSRDNGGDSDGEGRYGSGEIRYILKKDLGKDCGDHSGCKRNDSEKEEKMGKKEKKKKEEKRRKEELQNLKDDMLEALDERLGAWRKAKSSKAGSVSSPRPPFAGLGGPMGMGMDPNAMMNDPVMAQKLASMGLGPLMPMPPNMTVGGGHPYAMQAGIPGLSKMQAGMMDPQQQMGIRPGQVPMGMSYEDEISIADMEGVGLGNPYLGREARGRVVDPTGRRENGMPPKPMPFSAVRRGAGGRQRKLLHSQQQQTRRDFGSDEYDSPAPRPTGRAGSFHDDKDDAGDRDERDGPGLAATRIALPRDKAGRSSRDQKQPRIDSDHDEDYE